MHSNPRFISVGRPASIASRNSEAQWSWPGGRGRSQSNPPLDPMFPTWSTSHVLVLVSAIFSRQSFGIFATICIIPTSHAPVAQLDRVPGYEPGGRAFESLRARHTNRKGLPFFGRPFLFVLTVRFERPTKSIGVRPQIGDLWNIERSEMAPKG